MTEPKEKEVFETGTPKIRISLAEFRPDDVTVRVADELGNYTTFPVRDEHSGRQSARFLAEKIQVLAKPRKRRSPPRRARWWYVIKQKDVQTLPIYGIMDMLRHDGSQVECTGPHGFWMLSKDGADGAPLPNEERWRCFDIKIYVISKNVCPPTGEEVERCVAEEDRIIEMEKEKLACR